MHENCKERKTGMLQDTKLKKYYYNHKQNIWDKL